MGGTVAAQFPEFSQQYIQRLGGAVDALTEVVADFDASAAAEGLNRAEALGQMQGSAFLDRRRADMTRTFTRHAVLQSDLAILQTKGPFMRAYHAARFTDAEVARAAWNDFKPALPVTLDGLTFAGIGGVVGLMTTQGFISVMLWPIRRRRVA